MVANLNSFSNELSIGFDLERAMTMDVSEARWAVVPATEEGAKDAFHYYAETGSVLNSTLTVIILGLREGSWVQGWGNTDQPLRTPGAWPIIFISTRVARSTEPHWIAHELGHVIGFYDTTFYEARARANEWPSRCGFPIKGLSYPLASAAAGARANFVSYNTADRATFFSAGYEESFRAVFDCWVRMSRL